LLARIRKNREAAAGRLGADRKKRVGSSGDSTKRPASVLAIHVRSVPHADNCDRVRNQLEDYAEITDPKPVVSVPVPGKRLDVALAGITIASQRSQDPDRALPVHAAQFRARGFGPDNLQR